MLERTIFTHGLAREPDALGRAITRYFEALGPIDPLDVFGKPDWLPRIGRLKARPALRFFFAEVVDELIERRRALVASGAEAPHDLLTLLLKAQDPETGRGLSDLEVRANIVTFIGAGHETTANALTWTLYCLSQDETARETVEAEIDAAFAESPAPGMDALPRTKAALEEAMRLFPPVPFMSRRRSPRTGSAGSRSARFAGDGRPYVLHRHRRLWDQPDAFMPERFLPENRARIDRYAYLPFGAGPRVCIGASFSVMEATLVLAHVLHAVRLDRAPEAGPVVPLHR